MAFSCQDTCCGWLRWANPICLSTWKTAQKISIILASMTWPLSYYWSCFWYVALVWISTTGILVQTSQRCFKGVNCCDNRKKPCGRSRLSILSHFFTWRNLRKALIVHRLMICAHNSCWMWSLILSLVHETEMLYLVSRKRTMAVISACNYYLLYERPCMIILCHFAAWKVSWKFYGVAA